MKNHKSEILKYKKRAAYTEIKGFDVFAKEGHFIEVTQWTSGEGFDVDVETTDSIHFHLTYGQFEALKALVKKLDKV